MSFSGFQKELQGDVIQNDGFWPNMDAALFNAAYRVPGEYDVETVKTHLKLSIMRVNRQLVEFKAEHMADGRKTLLDVPGVEIGGESALVGLYRHAVSCRAKAGLIQQFRPLTRSKGADSTLEEMDESAAAEGKWLQYSDEAIADLLGVETVRVVLI